MAAVERSRCCCCLISGIKKRDDIPPPRAGWTRLDETEEPDGEGDGGDHRSGLGLGGSVKVETGSTGRSGTVLASRSSGLQSSGREEVVDDL